VFVVPERAFLWWKTSLGHFGESQRGPTDDYGRTAQHFPFLSLHRSM
jgi:hypothetical protein